MVRARADRGFGANRVLKRAVTAGTMLSVGAVAVTGVFVAKIAESYAATHQGPAATSPGSGGAQTQQPTNGGGQVSAPPQNQPQQDQQSVGGSNGS